MNPSSDVCKKCLIVGYAVLTKRCCGADPCYVVLQVDNINSYYSIIFVMIRWGPSNLYWNGVSTFMLMPFDLSHWCVSAYQQWISPCSTSCFDDISANLEYFISGDHKAFGCWSLMRIIPRWLLGLLPSLPRLYNRAPMLHSLSCRQ